MKKSIIRIMLLTILLIFVFITKVNATVTSNDPKTNSGGEVSITLKSSETVYAYKITLADAGGLTFQSATSTSGQANGTITNGASTTGVNSLATYKFKVPEVTSTTIYSVRFNVSISTDGDTYTEISNTSKVTVNAPVQNTTPTPTTPSTPTQTVTKSTDATLKSITLGNKTFSGSSLNSAISYTVESSVKTINISAVKNDSKASISGTGTKSLIAGQTNSFTIKVIAEDGTTTKNYKINIIRLAEESNEPNIIENEEQQEEKQEALKLTSLIIKDVELNTEFNPDVLNYVINVENLTELEIDATTNKDGAQINIEGASKLQAGDNKVLITVTLGEESIQYTIDVYNKIEDIEENNDEITQRDEEKNLTVNIKQIILYNWRIIALITLVCLLGIIAITCAIREYRNSNEDYEDDIPNEEELNHLEDIYTKRTGESNSITESKEKNKKRGKHF